MPQKSNSELLSGILGTLDAILQTQEQQQAKYTQQVTVEVKNNKYIIENWTSVKDLVFKEYKLDNAKYDVYELEWKWFDSDNDSKVSDDSFYNININIQSNGLKKGEK